MDPDIAIRCDGLSKKYSKSLKRAMLYGIADIGRAVFRIPASSEKLRKDEFWALHDLSLEVKKGQVLGVIGPNGVGKTTLLMLLNGIIAPDQGSVLVRGRTGALIAVGAGFHPLLTGRQNIYLNGSILGMTKKEVQHNFDAIVDFAGIGEFLDSPVKYYSSGMFVRLGFSVAVHCDIDILLVDEVLAVGDAGFILKCYNKIGELINKGTTVVLVTHNLMHVERFCDTCLLLEKGNKVRFGSPYELCREYQMSAFRMQKHERGGEEYEDSTLFVKMLFLDEQGHIRKRFNPSEKVVLRAVLGIKQGSIQPRLEVKMHSTCGLTIFHKMIDVNDRFLENSLGFVDIHFDSLPFNNDSILVKLFVWEKDRTHVLESGLMDTIEIVSKEDLQGRIYIDYHVTSGLLQYDKLK